MGKREYCKCAECGRELTPEVRTFRLHVSAPYDVWDTVVCEECHRRVGSCKNI